MYLLCDFSDASIYKILNDYIYKYNDFATIFERVNYIDEGNHRCIHVCIYKSTTKKRAWCEKSYRKIKFKKDSLFPSIYNFCVNTFALSCCGLYSTSSNTYKYMNALITHIKKIIILPAITMQNTVVFVHNHTHTHNT